MIRSATASDVPAVLPMIRAICSLHEAWDAARYGMLDDVVARYERWLPQRARDPRSVFLVAESQDHLTGFLVGEVLDNIPIYRVREYGFIHDMWVDPAARRSGTGRALLAAAIQRFKDIGVEQIRLETALANDAARKLFESCGFRTSTIDMLLSLQE
ncbi:MAG: Mycothiol acetyltransferase [Phycisphaerales bacterium]|nr:Mycothiol acetyltransferase [Phycisphaerales bacterium]